jgi:3-methylcrotonyl-CoA carboxylase alpha subunit
MAEPPTPSAAALSAGAVRLAAATIAPGFRLNAAPALTAPFLLDGERVDIALTGAGSQNPAVSTLVTESGQAWLLQPWRKLAIAGAGVSTGAILAPMPGKVIAVEAARGQVVTKGQKLLTLEAMKMEHTLTAPFDGVVAELNTHAGAQVQVEALLARIEASAILGEEIA